MSKLFPKILLPVETVNLLAGQYLEQALASIETSAIPSNTLLDKTITGVGATHLELHSKRHSIIIEPTLPVIHDKAQGNHFLPVYQNCKPHDVKIYLQKHAIQYKKILTTPESFWKIKTACQDLEIDMYKEFFCLFDECEKLTEDRDYRNKISKPMKDFFQFEGKAFVSATPLQVSDPRFNGFKTMKIVPQYDYREELELIVTNSYERSVCKLLLEDLKDSPCIFIFLNTTNGIDKLITALNIKDQSKIFCSDISKTKLKKRDYANVESLYQEPLSKYNFMTCRFYSALDINLHQQPDVVMLTNLYEASHSMIDPFTSAIQIQGRFRKSFDGKRYKSLTHISNVRNIRDIKTEQQLDDELSVFLETYQGLQERYKNEQNVAIRNILLSEMKRIQFAEFTNKDEHENLEIDYFAIDNYYHNEQVKNCYQVKDTLLQAYEETGYFKVTCSNHCYVFGDKEKFELEEKEMSFAQRCKKLVEILEQQQNNADRSFVEILRETKFGDIIIEAYMSLGKEIFERKFYQKAKITEALDVYNDTQKRFSPAILDNIKNEYPLHQSLLQKEIKDKLIEIYHRFGIQHKVKTNTIEEYFNASPSFYKKPYTYTLNSFKY